MQNHAEISMEISQKIKPLQFFNEYLRHGAFPFISEGEDMYLHKLRNALNLILDVDLHAVANLDYGLLTKIKKLLFAISTSVPFMPNVTKLSNCYEID